MAERRDGERVNEIREFQKCRSTSSTEAIWRILGYDINYMSVTVRELKAKLVHENATPPSLNDVQKYFARPLDSLFDNMTMLEYYEKYEIVNFFVFSRLCRATD
jgi:hypothetical protein